VYDDIDVKDAGSSTEHVAHIGRKAGRGLTWTLLGTFGTKFGSLAVGMVMARLLTPADFGVYAVAVAAAAFAMYVNDVGIIAACVQWRGKLEDIAPTASVIAAVSSVLAYGAIWLCAPSFADLAGVPDAAPVVRILSLIIVVDGITGVQSAALMRRFQQDRLTKANMIGWVANTAVALPMAFGGSGAYSFVCGQLAGSIVTGVIVYKMSQLPIQVGFDREVTKRLLIFGLPWAVTLGIEAVLLNADFVIVGNVLGAGALGFYMLAFNISNWVPGLVGTAVRYVALPSFSRLAEHDPEALQLGVRRSVPILVSAVLPVAAVMATLAPQIIEVLYGEKWGPSAVVLRFLAALMVVRMLTAFATDILASMGSTKATTWLNAGWALALLPALWIGTHLDGIRGAAIAHSVVAVVVALPLSILAVRRAGVRLLPTVPALVRPFLGAIVSAVVILLVQRVVGNNSLVQLVIAGGAGMLAFVLSVITRDQIRQIRTRLTRVRST
jgi:PST family polysaccharide transporter